MPLGGWYCWPVFASTPSTRSSDSFSSWIRAQQWQQQDVMQSPQPPPWMPNCLRASPRLIICGIHCQPPKHSAPYQIRHWSPRISHRLRKRVAWLTYIGVELEETWIALALVACLCLADLEACTEVDLEAKLTWSTVAEAIVPVAAMRMLALLGDGLLLAIDRLLWLAVVRLHWLLVLLLVVHLVFEGWTNIGWRAAGKAGQHKYEVVMCTRWKERMIAVMWGEKKTESKMTRAWLLLKTGKA